MKLTYFRKETIEFTLIIYATSKYIRCVLIPNLTHIHTLGNCFTIKCSLYVAGRDVN